ncbi:hypothetical protein LRN42_000010 [Shigella sonnei]|nr:hypothetical protein [Shigella sonnei]
MTPIYHDLSAEQRAHFFSLKQHAVDKTEFFNKFNDDYTWGLTTDANNGVYSIPIESIILSELPDADNNAVFFLKDASVPGGISYYTRSRDQACASLWGLIENMRIKHNGRILPYPDLYMVAIKRCPYEKTVINLKKEFDDFKTDASLPSIEKCAETTGPLYRHPCCSEGFDTYLTVTTGYSDTAPDDVLIGTWCIVREVYPDGTIITADGDRLAPALSTYADAFKNEGTFNRQNLVYYVLAVNSNRPSQKGFSSAKQNAPYGFNPYNNMFNQYNPYYETIRQAQRYVGPYNPDAK